jgi:hypothetical protein
VPKPLISVVLPARDAGEYLEIAVNSILTQDWRDLELLVVDDASTDGSTAELLTQVKDDRLQFVRNERRLGLAATLNRGIQEARGSLIARMDADDIALKSRLTRQITFLEKNPSVMIVGGDIQPVDDKGHPLGQAWLFPLLPWQIRWRMLFSCSLAHPSVLIRREFFDRVGPYAEDHPAGSEDYELWLRGLELVDMANISETVLLYRRHSSSVTLKQDLHHPYVRKAGMRTIQRIIEREITEAELDALWTPGNSTSAHDAEALVGAIDILHNLFAHFEMKPLSTPEREYIRYRAAWSLRPILRSLAKVSPARATSLGLASPLVNMKNSLGAAAEKIGLKRRPERL